MNDEEHVQCARALWNKDEPAIVELCMSMTDRERGKYELLIYYQWFYDSVQHNAQYYGKAMDMADELKASPRYSSEAYFRKGHLLRSQGKYQEAIAAYTTASNGPDNLFCIAECHSAMSKIDSAISTYRQIETSYKNSAAQAAWRAAQLYKNSDQKEYINRLRSILSKYPQSGESSEAHIELSRLQVSVIGGGMLEGDKK
jgi:tetratricopeptide (TPR) repeat protein